MAAVAAQPRKAEIREQLALYARDDREPGSVGRRRRQLLEVKSEVAVALVVRQALLRLPRPERTLSEATGAQVQTLPSAGIERGPKRRRSSRPITAGESQRDRERAASEEPLHESLLCVRDRDFAPQGFHRVGAGRWGVPYGGDIPHGQRVVKCAHPAHCHMAAAPTDAARCPAIHASPGRSAARLSSFSSRASRARPIGSGSGGGW